MEVKVPTVYTGGKREGALPCCLCIVPRHNYVKFPKWALCYLLDHEPTESDRFKIGVFTEPKKGELYLEPGFGRGRENLRTNELLQKRGNYGDAWLYFYSKRIVELLVDPIHQRSNQRFYFRFYLEPERVRLVIRYTEKPSHKFKASLTLAARRKFFL